LPKLDQTELSDLIHRLRRVDVDPCNGYRRCGIAQVPTARLIGMLRGADLTLAEIGQFLADLDKDRDLATGRLDQHLIELEARHTSSRFCTTRLRGLRPLHLETLYDRMLHPGDGQRALAPKTVDEVHLIIRVALGDECCRLRGSSPSLDRHHSLGRHVASLHGEHRKSSSLRIAWM
jgi:DNA-binding transcriptional MerR regulator